MKDSAHWAIWTLVGALASAAEACVDRELEPNNNPVASNGPLCTDQPVSGSLRRSGRSQDRSDFFHLQWAAQASVILDLTHASGMVLELVLLDAQGAEIGSVRSPGIPGRSLTADLSPGDYFVEVYARSGRGDYALSMSSGAQSASCSYGPRPPRPPDLQAWITGGEQDLCVTPAGPGVLLMGGNFDVDEAFATRVAPVIRGGDVVVLRSRGTDGYNGYLDPLLQAHSVETLVLDTREKANAEYSDWALRSAEFVFIAGGDQSEYLNAWQGTRTESAIEHVYAKGGVIGGISAGMAVHGEFIYDPDGINGIYSSEAVTNPCHDHMNLSTGFLSVPLMDNLVTDSHFFERNRMGRLAVFMGRLLGPGLLPDSSAVEGIGVDEDTSLYIHQTGIGTVDGGGSVYVLRADGQTDFVQVQCGQPVVVDDLLRVRLQAGEWIDFGSNGHNGSAARIGVDGDSCSIGQTESENCFYRPDTNPY